MPYIYIKNSLALQKIYLNQTKKRERLHICKIERMVRD